MAAVGTIGDMGPQAPLALLEEAYGRYSKSSLREATVLINSAARASAYDCQTALRALQRASGPQEISGRKLPEARLLQEFREEVNRELKRCSRMAPRFQGQIAYIPLESRCDISGLMATRWARRLPRHAALVANYGYLPGQVIYDIRTVADMDVLALMNALGPEGERIAYGQPQSAGGTVKERAWREALEALGFVKDED